MKEGKIQLEWIRGLNKPKYRKKIFNNLYIKKYLEKAGLKRIKTYLPKYDISYQLWPLDPLYESKYIFYKRKLPTIFILYEDILVDDALWKFYFESFFY